MKNKLVGAIGAVAMSISINASAQMPTTDAATLAEVITGNQERSLMHFAEQAWERAKMKFNAESSAKQIDTMNNGFANVVMRTTQTATDLFNMERLMESLPAISACGSVTISAIGKDSMCSEQQAIQEASKRHADRHNTFGMSAQEQREVAAELNKKHFERCREMSGGDISNNVCIDGSGLFGSKGDTLSPEDAEATQSFIDHIVGVAPVMKSTPHDPDNMTPDEISRYNMEQRREAYRSLVSESFSFIEAERLSPDAANYVPSSLHRLKAFSNERWGNNEWIQNMTNTNPENPNAVMETQLLREMVVMDAFSVHLDIIRYEQALRDYTLQAAMLSLLKDRL